MKKTNEDKNADSIKPNVPTAAASPMKIVS
jgi:hypothetical protein